MEGKPVPPPKPASQPTYPVSKVLQRLAQYTERCGVREGEVTTKGSTQKVLQAWGKGTTQVRVGEGV